MGNQYPADVGMVDHVGHAVFSSQFPADYVQPVPGKGNGKHDPGRGGDIVRTRRQADCTGHIRRERAGAVGQDNRAGMDVYLRADRQ